MGVALTVAVECSFDGGGSWTDVTSDVRAPEGIRFRRGLSEAWITDRIAPAGQLQLAFDNRAQRYSPDSPNARTGFGIGTPIRIALSSPVLPGRTFYVWRGRITQIQPEPGKLGRRTWVTAHDWFEEAARQSTPRLGVMTNVRADEVVQQLLAATPRPPRAVAIMTGSDLLPIALDASPSERGNLYTELAKLTLSEVGYCYLRGDESGGETLVWENRRYRPKQTVDLATLSDDMVGLSVVRDADQVINDIAVSAVPSRADSSPVVLYSLESRPKLSANVPLTFDAPYRDPAQRAERVGGKNMVAPVAGTDYTANSKADGTGTDLTGSVTVSVIFWATMARVTVTSSVDAYLTKLQLRGLGLYRYERAWTVTSDTASQTIYGMRELRLDLPYQPNIQSSQDVGSYLALLGRTPRSVVRRVAFLANASADLMQAALLRDISDRIRISESASGVSGTYYLQAVEWEIAAGPIGRVIWTLAPSAGLAFWRLGIAGRSELGQTTWLGPAIAHGDIAHQDHTDSSHSDVAHGDAGHNDVAHSDVAHSDVAHSDVAHSDSHGDTPHGDAAHNDVPHSDSHGDALHSDGPHNDSAHTDSHSDVAHSDTAHTDSHADTAHQDAHDDWHDDWHDDVGIGRGPDHSDFHTDLHFDSHSDTPHDDSHGDVAHGDTAHDDSHGDVAHGDAAHGDSPHSDSHSDVAHGDGSHSDVAHSDVAHSDVAHSDVAHSDSHGDTPHGDAAHNDVPHSDSHSDAPHDDIQHIDD